MRSKIGSKVHKSTAIKRVAGLVAFSGVYVKGNVWSKDGKSPALYSSRIVAERMAVRYGLRTKYAGSYWVVME